MGSDVVCNSGVVGRLVQLPAVHGYGHVEQVADKYLCPVVGKQPRDYNVGLSINYVDIANSFIMSEIMSQVSLRVFELTKCL